LRFEVKTVKLLFAITLALTCLPAVSSETFKDVPKDHWAGGAVQKLKDEGIVQGYPDGTFKGNQPVTRYELAAALARFVEFLQESEKPVLKDEKTPDPQSSAPKEPAAALVDGGFLPKDSALAKDGKKQVTSQELADALASVAKKLIELRVKEEPAESQPGKADSSLRSE
jgi:hypothetical protein